MKISLKVTELQELVYKCTRIFGKNNQRGITGGKIILVPDTSLDLIHIPIRFDKDIIII